MGALLRKLDDKYVLRLPDGLRDRIKSIAAANKRSMNSEIIFHLERALVAPLTEREAS